MPPTPLPEAFAGRPFLGADAVAAGMSRRVLSGGQYRRLFRDVFVETSVPDSLALRCAAARLVLPKDAAFSHHTAAALRRLPVPDSPALHALVPTAAAVRIAGIRAHRGLKSADVCRLGELLVTTIDRTFLDLAGILEELVVFGDAALF